jgi:hypothetical protein
MTRDPCRDISSNVKTRCCARCCSSTTDRWASWRLRKGSPKRCLQPAPRGPRPTAGFSPALPSGPGGRSAADEFATAVETAALITAELGEYCRKRGLYREQAWAGRAACEHADDWAGQRVPELQRDQSELRR